MKEDNKLPDYWELGKDEYAVLKTSEAQKNINTGSLETIKPLLENASKTRNKPFFPNRWTSKMIPSGKYMIQWTGLKGAKRYAILQRVDDKGRLISRTRKAYYLTRDKEFKSEGRANNGNYNEGTNSNNVSNFSTYENIHQI